MKTVLITGSSRGIGKECALAFATNGWNVIIHGYTHKNDINLLESQIKDFGVSCHSFIGNILDPAFVSSMIKEAINIFGSIDCLVNNAGISKVGLFTDMSLTDWNEMIATNLTSVFMTSKSILPHMIGNHHGKIINISSVWGDTGASCEVAYSTTKGGINAMTKSLAKEVAPSGIQVNAIAFGMIDTDMNGHLTAEEKKDIKDEIPADYICTAKEAAQMIFHAASAPDYMTGQVITFSGGWN